MLTVSSRGARNSGILIPFTQLSLFWQNVWVCEVGRKSGIAYLRTQPTFNRNIYMD